MQLACDRDFVLEPLRQSRALQTLERWTLCCRPKGQLEQ